MRQDKPFDEIVFFMHGTGLGGAELAALDIIRQCIDWSFRTSVVCHKQGALAPDLYELVHGRYLRVPFPYRGQPFSWLRLPGFKLAFSNFSAERRSRKILFSTDFLSLWATLHAKARGNRVVSLWQGEYDFTNDSCLRKWIRYGALRADVLCASEPVAQHANRQGLLGAEVQTMNPYINLRRLAPQEHGRDDERHKYDLPRKEKVAVCIGRIGEGKGQFALAEAFVQSHLNRNWKLVFAGPADPVNAQRMRDLCASPPNGCLRWLGPIKTVPGLLTAADLVVAPNTCQESFGLTQLEAVLMGKALIGFAVGAVPYVIGTSYPGLVNKVGDFSALMTLWDNPDSLDKLAHESKILAAQLAKRFGVDTWKESLERILLQESIA